MTTGTGQNVRFKFQCLSCYYTEINLKRFLEQRNLSECMITLKHFHNHLLYCCFHTSALEKMHFITFNLKFIKYNFIISSLYRLIIIIIIIIISQFTECSHFTSAFLCNIKSIKHFLIIRVIIAQIGINNSPVSPLLWGQTPNEYLKYDTNPSG